MRQKNKPQDQQRPTLSGWDQVRASDVRIGLLSEADVPTATARTATPQQMRWKASGEREGRRRETKWRPSLRETLRKDRATGLRGWPKPPCDNAPDAIILCCVATGCQSGEAELFGFVVSKIRLLPSNENAICSGTTDARHPLLAMYLRARSSVQPRNCFRIGAVRRTIPSVSNPATKCGATTRTSFTALASCSSRRCRVSEAV